MGWQKKNNSTILLLLEEQNIKRAIHRMMEPGNVEQVKNGEESVD